MSKSVVEEYEQICHYTSTRGLQGIIQSQSLWATQISFLNDSEEQIAFFDRRAPLLLDGTCRAAVDHLMTIPSWKTAIEGAGGYDKYFEDQKQAVLSALRKATLTFDDPYITSFCTAKNSEIVQDGLLSQWRAYGPDGGYAIVFDTAKLEALLKKEAGLFAYQLSSWGTVNYYHDTQDQETVLEEIQEYEEVVKRGIFDFLITGDKDKLDPIYDKVSYLSCIYKHRGFHEERELRIVMVLTHEDVLNEEKNLGQSSRPKKTVKYIERNGCLVPYICLFDDVDSSGEMGLAIKRIIVGPHPDKEKRKTAIESLLNQSGINAEVTISGIPYLGR